MTFTHLAVIVAVVALVALYVSVDRARTIAKVEFVNGKARVVRGRLAARVLVEIRDVAGRMRIRSGHMVLRKDGALVGVELQGVEDPRAAQQLRNVIGRFRLPELRS